MMQSDSLSELMRDDRLVPLGPALQTQAYRNEEEVIHAANEHLATTVNSGKAGTEGGVHSPGPRAGGGAGGELMWCGAVCCGVSVGLAGHRARPGRGPAARLPLATRHAARKGETGPASMARDEEGAQISAVGAMDDGERGV
jgi:hypothetical protein